MEFESTLRFDVVDVITREVLHHFEGEYSATYERNSYCSGVQDVVVEGDVLRVRYADERTENLPLPRVLTKEEMKSLEAVFPPFYDALDSYRYVEGWSSDVSIPGAAVEKERQAMLLAFKPVASCLDTLGIRNTPAKQLRWGKVSPELERWLREDAHLSGKRLC